MTDASILLQTLGGSWEWVGSDRRAGIWYESLSAEADEWGSSKASFTLKRDPTAMFPDLSAFTPVDILSSGVLVWSGRIAETPTRDGADRSVNVQAQGWQYHLDDDQFPRLHVATKLGEFKDSRAIPTVDLNLYRAAGNVTNARGLVIGWGQSENVQNTVRVGATFDAGPGNTINTVVYELTYRNGHSTTMEFTIMGTVASESPFGTDGVANTSFNIAGGTAETSAAITGNAFATPVRFVHVYLKNVGGDSASLAGEVYARLRSIMLVADATWQSGNESRLSADKIVTDALRKGTLLLSADRTGITTSSFFFPAFGTRELRTPREVWNAANSALDWTAQIDVNRRPIFAPKPTTAAFEIGDWSAATFEDASSNSGEDIYNRALIAGSTPTGLAFIGESLAAAQPGALVTSVSSPAPSNPTFAVNTTSWTASSGTTITRDTVVFDTSPASGRWDRGGGALGAGDTLSEAFTGTFTAGVPYQLTLVARSSATSQAVLASFGASDDDSATDGFHLTASFSAFSIAWTPLATTTSVSFDLGLLETTGFVYVDSLALATAVPTLVDRRGFRRAKSLTVNNSLTQELADQLGSTYLAGHRNTPLKGTVKVMGRSSVRDVLTGQHIPPERMLIHTMKMLRLSHRIDPDNGSLQRDGRIVNVHVDFEQPAATLALDNSRASFEALLSRLSAVIGEA